MADDVQLGKMIAKTFKVFGISSSDFEIPYQDILENLGGLDLDSAKKRRKWLLFLVEIL